MPDPTHALGVYLHLVRSAERRNQPFVCSRMFVLAGTAAADLQLAPLANYCRKQILRHNPRHMLGRWPSFEEALLDTEFLALVRQLRRRFPLEKAERMLETLGIEPEAPSDDGLLAFAAHILGIDVQKIEAEP